MLRAFVASLAILVLAPIPALAGKTVNVRGYTRKDGTHVSPHTRSSPGSGSSFSSDPGIHAAPVVPRTEYRTSYRSSAVTTARTDFPKLQPADESKATANSTNPWARDDLPEDDRSERKGSAKLSSSKHLTEPTIAANAPRRLVGEHTPSVPERLATVLVDVTTLDDDKEDGVFSVELFQGSASIFHHDYGDGQRWRENTRKSFSETINVPIDDGDFRLVTNLEAKSAQKKITWVARVNVTVETNRKRRLEWAGGAKFEVDHQKPSYSFHMGTKHLPDQ